MRISDLSSDVWSSDLKTFDLLVDGSNPSRPTTYKSEEVRHSPEFGIQPRISRGFLCALVQRCPVESGDKVSHPVSPRPPARRLTPKCLTHMLTATRLRPLNPRANTFRPTEPTVLCLQVRHHDP